MVDEESSWGKAGKESNKVQGFRSSRAPASTPKVALVHSCFDVDVVELYRQKGPDFAA